MIAYGNVEASSSLLSPFVNLYLAVVFMTF